MQLPEYVKQGEPARLFAVGSMSNKERRATSTLLAVLPVFPELARKLLDTVGFRLAKKSKIRAFTEIVIKGSSEKDRPDGLLVIEQNKKTYTVLVEAKVDKAQIDKDQLERYLKLAAESKIDAVITISNQFVSNPTISPIEGIPKPLLRKTELYHWSWTSILTQFQLMRSAGEIQDQEKTIILDELIRYFTHPSTGVETFGQMNQGWKELVRTVGTGSQLSGSDSNLLDAVNAWIQEERDLSLLLSRVVGLPVSIYLPRKLQSDADARRKDVKDTLVSENKLISVFRVPDAAGDLQVVADLARKSVSVSMSVRAPDDRKSTSARVNWLLRMIKADDDRIYIRANWPSRVSPTQETISKLRDNSGSIQAENSNLVPGSFEVLLITETGGRFSGRKTFIEDLEKAVPEFYQLIGQNIRAWQKRPPKIENTQSDTDIPSSAQPQSTADFTTNAEVSAATSNDTSTQEHHDEIETVDPKSG